VIRVVRRKRCNGDKSLVWITLAGAVDPVVQLLAPRCGAIGQARQRIGEAFVLVLDVKDIAMAGCVAPAGLLPDAQTLPRIGNRIVRIQSLPGGVEQKHAQVSASRCCSMANR
jgi:hypothetical protein